MSEKLPTITEQPKDPWELDDLGPELQWIYDNSIARAQETTAYLQQCYNLGKIVGEIADRYEAVIPLFLKKYGIDAPIEKVRPGLYRLPAPDLNLPNLPFGYAYCGGSARTALELALEIQNPSHPRDYDVTRLVSPDPNDPEYAKSIADTDLELSQTIMIEDYNKSGGKHGVKEIEDDYFATRDFTVNEVLLSDQWVYCTTACLIDTVRGYIRLSDNEVWSEAGTITAKEKLSIKALRLAAEFADRGQLGNLDLRNVEITNASNDYFHVALQFEKALEQGGSVPERYLEFLHQHDEIPDHIETVPELFVFLNKQFSNEERTGFFRSAPANLIASEPAFVAGLNEAMGDFPDWYAKTLEKLPHITKDDAAWFGYLRDALIAINMADQNGSDVELPQAYDKTISRTPLIDDYYPGDTLPFHLIPTLRTQLIQHYDRFQKDMEDDLRE